MGQTLSSAAQWTAVKEGTGRGRLEYTPTNDAIISKVIDFVQTFPSGHPEDSKITFKQPLTWKSELTLSHFSSGYKIRDAVIESEELDSTGQPALTARSIDGGTLELSVFTFHQLRAVLQISGDKKKKETRLCLEANADPIARILGDRFASISGSDDSIYRYVEEIMSATPTAAEDEQQEQLTALRLLLLLREFDDRLTREAVKDIAAEVKLSPDDVGRAFEILKNFCGAEPSKYLLKHIEWTPPYRTEYKDGCRAPFIRQVHGDIAYITVHTHSAGAAAAATGGDDESKHKVLHITASTSGYFVNSGIDRETRELKFEAKSPYYRNLLILLRDNDQHFSTLIDQSDIYEQKRRSRTNSTSSQTESNYVLDRSKPTTIVKKEGQDVSRRDYANEKKTVKKTEQERPLKHSSVWKNLGLDEKKEEKKDVKKEEEKKKELRTPSGKKKSNGETVRGEAPELVTSSSESEGDEDTMWRYPESATDLPQEYWQIQKLIRYLKGGNQTATVIALCSLLDFDLELEVCQQAIREVGGLEILINLLETDRDKCKIGALKILKEISKNANIRRSIADLGAIQKMIEILKKKEQDKELKCLAAETIANVAKFRRARRAVRHSGGINQLVLLLSHPSTDVARSGALALWSCCCQSERNKESMRDSGAIPALAKLLKSNNTTSLIPVVGTLQECADNPHYRKAIRTEGMIGDLVRNLRSNNTELQTLSANALFKCAVDKQTRDMIREYNGLDPLVDLVTVTNGNRELLAATTGAIWKCAISPENVQRFKKRQVVEPLVALLSNQPEEVLVNVAGALAELVKDDDVKVVVRKSNGLPVLVQLLTGTNNALLVNATRAVGLCAEDTENMTIIDKLDGVRLLWSLLKNKNEEVQAHAAWAICPCIENTKDAGEMVRSFVGGLELVVGLLSSENTEVLSAVCAAIANIANDEENLAVITDHGVVGGLAALAPMTDEKLRQHLAEAVARCCNWSNNRVEFGTKGVVPHLVSYLASPRTEVRRSTARALHQLSKYPDNCISMHDNGVVKPLLQLIGSDDCALQEAAAGCLSNIRRLAMANERARRQRQADREAKKIKNKQNMEFTATA